MAGTFAHPSRAVDSLPFGSRSRTVDRVTTVPPPRSGAAATDTAVGGRRRPPRHRAAVAEIALALPLFLVVLVSVVDLGSNYADHLDTQRSTAATAQALAAGRLDEGTTCDLHVDGLGREQQRLVCTAKAETHADVDAARVKLVAGPDHQGGGSPSTTETICVMTRATSATGLLTGAFSGHVHTSLARVSVPVVEAVTAAEPPLEGGDWSWCTAAT